MRIIVLLYLFASLTLTAAEPRSLPRNEGCERLTVLDFKVSKDKSLNRIVRSLPTVTALQGLINRSESTYIDLNHDGSLRAPNLGSASKWSPARLGWATGRPRGGFLRKWAAGPQKTRPQAANPDQGRGGVRRRREGAAPPLREASTTRRSASSTPSRSTATRRSSSSTPGSSRIPTRRPSSTRARTTPVWPGCSTTTASA